MKYPKYKCIENDVIIEYNREDQEFYVYAEGETVKTVIGVVDLKMALEKWGLCKVERSARGGVLIDQTLRNEKTVKN